MIEQLIAMYPWPDRPPNVPRNLGPVWFHDDEATGHTRPLKGLVGPQTRVLLELGSFAGRSTACFLRICPNAHVIAVDTWLGSPEYDSLPEALAMLPRLFETFQANLWEYRQRLTAIRATTVDGMRIVSDHGVVPDAVYVDADHGTESVMQDLACIRRLFPQARIVGDDWLWPSVREAVERRAREWGATVATSGNVWWLLPGNPPATFEEGWQLHQAGQRRQAERVYRRILQRDHLNAQVWFALGSLLMDEHRVAEAVPHFRQALELAPREAEGFFHLGNALLQLQQWSEALTPYRKCLELKPDHVEALVNLGCALGELGRHAEAEVGYRRALQLNPDVAEIHHNLGNALRDQGRPAEAIECYHAALALRPDYAKAEINLGVALVTLGQVDEAVVRLRRGVALEPGVAEAHSSLGAALSAQGNIDEALDAYDTAIRLKPDYPDAHWNRSLNWLLLGDFERGWPAYEWRWRCKRTGPAPNFSQPRWDGSPLNGRTILLCSEQGLGDTLQFVRYAPLVQALGGNVVLRCQRSLVPILASLTGVSRLIAEGDPLPDFDLYAPLMSLPAILGTTLATVPANVPYLAAEPERVAHWGEVLRRTEFIPTSHGGTEFIPSSLVTSSGTANGMNSVLRTTNGMNSVLRVGIVWQGSILHPWDQHRSCKLAHFEPLTRIQGVRLVSLQKGPGTEQLQELSDNTGFTVDYLSGAVDESGAFLDTAAIMANLDLVVTVDTAAAHLAGALGKPCWLALAYTPDYRWLLGRDDSPWYPSMRLFRQPAVGDWDGLFERIAIELAAVIDRGGSQNQGHAGREPRIRTGEHGSEK